MASAAIPVVFPPVLVDTPKESRGWYCDGGIRLNAPIKPAVALGITRAIIMASDPIIQAVPRAAAVGPQPDVYTAAAGLLQSALVDRMIEDVRTLGKINELLESGTEAPALWRIARGMAWCFPYCTMYSGESA